MTMARHLYIPREFQPFFHRNTTEINNAMTINTINIPVLMRPTPTNPKRCILHVAYKCPYNRQSSCKSFTATVTSYIWVIEILKLRMEMTFPYEGHTSCPSFS